MQVKTHLRYLRTAPRKVRQVADLIRGKKVEEARTILNFTRKKAAQPILKALNSALANAKNNWQIDPANLFISEIRVDEGPKYKRWRARARGQAYEIQKKTSHIALVLKDKEMEGKPKKAKRARKAKVTEVEQAAKVEKTAKAEKPKFRPEKEAAKPTVQKGFKRIFRRKAF